MYTCVLLQECAKQYIKAVAMILPLAIQDEAALC